MVVGVGVSVCCGAEEALERGEGKVKFWGGHCWCFVCFVLVFGAVGFVEYSCRLSRLLELRSDFRVCIIT